MFVIRLTVSQAVTREVARLEAERIAAEEEAERIAAESEALRKHMNNFLLTEPEGASG